jgi:membrane protease subunit HflK
MTVRRLARYAVVSAIVLYLLTGVASVRPGERAVVRRFGAVVATPGPGLWVGLPWGIDRIDRVEVDRIRRIRFGYEFGANEDVALPPGQLLTGDQNLVNVRVVIDYAVRGDQVAQFLAVRQRVDGAVNRAAEASLAEWVAGRPVDDVLLMGKAILPGLLAARLRERLEPYRLGIEVQSAAVDELAPPDEVKGAFAAVTSAQAAIHTREQEAARDADELLRKARTHQYEWRQSAAAVAHERVALARVEAESFRKRLEQYRRLSLSNSNVLTALWWDEMAPLFSRLNAVGRIGLLDNYLGADGLDIMQFGPRPPGK